MKLYRGIHWGQLNENGIWLALCRRIRLQILKNDTLLYLAVGLLRVRVMKP